MGSGRAREHIATSLHAEIELLESDEKWKGGQAPVAVGARLSPSASYVIACFLPSTLPVLLTSIESILHVCG